MAFTRPWSNTAPLGSVAAATIDTEIQAVRKDVQERIDVEHQFPTTDVAGTGLHKEGSARIFVGTAAEAVGHLEGVTTAYRVGLMHYSTDTKKLLIQTENAVTTTIDVKKLDSLIKFSSIILYQVPLPLLGYELAYVDTISNPNLHIHIEKFTQYTTEAMIAGGDGFLTTHIPFSSLPGLSASTLLQARLVAHGLATTTTNTLNARYKSAYPVAITDPVLCSVDITSGLAYTLGTWTDVTLDDDMYVSISTKGTDANTYTLYRLELQFRINE